MRLAITIVVIFATLGCAQQHECTPHASQECPGCLVRYCSADGTWGACMAHGWLCDSGPLPDAGGQPDAAPIVDAAPTECTPFDVMDCNECTARQCQADGTWGACHWLGRPCDAWVPTLDAGAP